MAASLLEKIDKENLETRVVVGSILVGILGGILYFYMLLSLLNIRKNLDQLKSLYLLEAENFITSINIVRDQISLIAELSFLFWLLMSIFGLIIIVYVSKIAKRYQIAQEDLKIYAEQLEKSNSLKDVFTDIMSHDLLNPAGSIRSYADIQRDELTDKGQKGVAERIKNLADDIIAMIEEATTYARIEKLTDIEVKKLDLAKMLKETAKRYQLQLDKKKIRVEYTAKGRYPIKANQMIEHIFINLLGNAIKYSPEKTVITMGVEEEGEDWKIHVKDQGEGIKDDYKETVFNRFQRIQKKGVKGTGIGLSIVKKIVDIHGGSVWVEDNPGGGSIFYVRLPKNHR